MTHARRGEPLYRWVTEALRARIKNGEYSPGARLPSMTELRAEFHVSDVTVRSALKELAQRGLVETRPRRGVYVCSARAQLWGIDERVIAIIVQESDSVFSSTILRAVEDECREHDHHVLMMSTRGDIEVEKRLLRELSQKVAGLLVIPNLRGAYAAYQNLVAQGVPIVFLDQHAARLAISSVSTDNVLGGYLATRHLLEQGRRRVCFFGPPNIISVEERLNGYKKALKEAGVPFAPSLVCNIEDHSEIGCYSAALQLLREHADKEPIGVFAINDYIARIFCIAAEAANVRVPHDVAVVGYDDVIAAFCNPPLSSVRQDLAKMGRSAARLLLERLNNTSSETLPIQNLRLKPKLIVRDSSDANSGFSLVQHIENHPSKTT